jgi:4-amino-4-deoxy-L-arabinose transferase-like glycosyltransferase
MAVQRLELGLAHYFATFLLALTAYIFGRRILLKFRFDSAWEDIAYSIGLGLGVIIFLMMLLGFAKLLYPWLAVCLILALVAGCYPVYSYWPANLISALRRFKPLEKKSIIVIVAVVATILALLPVLEYPLYPPTGYDATSYHLPMARYFTEWHAIGVAPYLRFPVFTLNMQMLFTLMLMVGDGIDAQMVHYLTFILIAVALIAWGKRAQSLRSGLWAAAMVFASLHFFALASVADVDLGLTLFVTLGIYSFMNWISLRDDKWLWLSAVFLGLASGTKYSALFVVLMLAVVALYYDIRARRLRFSLIFALIAILVGCPWYIRNAIVAGNPVWPFFSDFFGYRFWSPGDLSAQMKEMQSHGTGRTILSLVTMPWNLVYHAELFGVEGTLSKAWLYALPIAVIVGTFRSYTRWLLAFVLAYFLFWFMSVQILRYLDPVLPALALVSGISLDMLLAWLPARKNAIVQTVATILILAAVLYPGMRSAWGGIGVLGQVPTTADEIAQFYKHGQNNPYLNMPLYDALNKNLGGNYVVYAFNDRDMVHFADGVLIGDWFGDARYTRIFQSTQDGWAFRNSEEVYRILHDELKADILILNCMKMRILPPDDEFFKTHFTPIAGINESGVTMSIAYELADSRAASITER